MDPSKRLEIVFLLVEEYFILVRGQYRVRGADLLRDDQVSDIELPVAL
jgi:hypothetical protein